MFERKEENWHHWDVEFLFVITTLHQSDGIMSPGKYSRCLSASETSVSVFNSSNVWERHITRETTLGLLD